MNFAPLGEVESRFADIIWSSEPITSTELAKRSEAILGWKKSTSYTVLKRLCDKGLFRNENGIVSSVISKSEYCSNQSRNFVNETFDGSLPAFLASFVSGRKLSENEYNEIKAMIDSFREVKQ